MQLIPDTMIYTGLPSDCVLSCMLYLSLLWRQLNVFRMLQSPVLSPPHSTLSLASVKIKLCQNVRTTIFIWQMCFQELISTFTWHILGTGCLSLCIYKVASEYYLSGFKQIDQPVTKIVVWMFSLWYAITVFTVWALKHPSNISKGRYPRTLKI